MCVCVCVCEGWLIINATLCRKFQDCFGCLYFPLHLKKWVHSGLFFNDLKILKSNLFPSDEKDFKSPGGLLSPML